MKRLTKTLLALSIVGFTSGILFAAGALKAGDAVGWYMLLPGGAICFGAFMISYMLEREVARFNGEQEARLADASKPESVADRDTEVHPSLSAKHAH